MPESAAPTAGAAPWSEAQFVKTFRCDSPDPWPGPRIAIPVDVYTGITFPSDGLPGPVLSLKANSPRPVGTMLNVTEYNIRTTVKWRNLRTGRTGTVVTPTRANRVIWNAVIHPGAGPVRLSVRQKIGAMAFVPMVNPQYRTCGTTATAR
ncbi:hypothetical protein [Gordonia zhaorongruii]|uniref:hypothetical protein n=1 Tax=Gordonia zhaorongruii TaxID=2597659 RepID=UPI001F3414C6|nr:hypothetical protein [Gordonia zhaorongruii]